MYTRLLHNADLLVRSHHEAPIRGGGDDALGTPLVQRLLVTQRWSILWKSIIASSLDSTLFPYCRYIKTLDFRDLGNLFGDEQFRSKVQKSVRSMLHASCVDLRQAILLRPSEAVREN